MSALPPIVAVVVVSSQAYGRREEAFGIHAALAGAAGAYAKARQAGHAVIALIVGKAMSGAFLAHGYQANRIIALNDPGVRGKAANRCSAVRQSLPSAAVWRSMQPQSRGRCEFPDARAGQANCAKNAAQRTSRCAAWRRV
jgi:malonate decarboxylase gamma subunit